MMHRYLSAPLVVDVEYMLLYTQEHMKTEGLHPLERYLSSIQRVVLKN